VVLQAFSEQLRVHRIASDVAADVVKQVRSFPYLERHAIGDQLIRAAIAVSSNIAEGSGRGTTSEFRRFLAYAQGSVRELGSLLRIARTSGLGERTTMSSLESRTALVGKMIARLHDHPPPQR